MFVLLSVSSLTRSQTSCSAKVLPWWVQDSPNGSGPSGGYGFAITAFVMTTDGLVWFGGGTLPMPNDVHVRGRSTGLGGILTRKRATSCLARSRHEQHDRFRRWPIWRRPFTHLFQRCLIRNP